MFVVPQPSDTPDSKKPENRFEFEVSGVTYSVPRLGFISQDAAALLEQGKELLGSYAAFDDAAALEAYKSLSPDQLRAFDTAWVNASKVSPGESRGSGGS